MQVHRRPGGQLSKVSSTGSPDTVSGHSDWHINTQCPFYVPKEEYSIKFEVSDSISNKSDTPERERPKKVKIKAIGNYNVSFLLVCTVLRMN